MKNTIKVYIDGPLKGTLSYDTYIDFNYKNMYTLCVNDDNSTQVLEVYCIHPYYDIIEYIFNKIEELKKEIEHMKNLYSISDTLINRELDE
jgi:hypothetical protein